MCTHSRASNTDNGNYHCRFAYNNNWNDGGGRAWATRGQGAGSWYRMTFRASYTNMVRFRQRGCGCEWYRRAQLEFSNGQRRTIQIGRNYNIQNLRFDWVGPVTWVMIVSFCSPSTPTPPCPAPAFLIEPVVPGVFCPAKSLQHPSRLLVVSAFRPTVVAGQQRRKRDHVHGVLCIRLH